VLFVIFAGRNPGGCAIETTGTALSDRWSHERVLDGYVELFRKRKSKILFHLAQFLSPIRQKQLRISPFSSASERGLIFSAAPCCLKRASLDFFSTTLEPTARGLFPRTSWNGCASSVLICNTSLKLRSCGLDNP